MRTTWKPLSNETPLTFLLSLTFLCLIGSSSVAFSLDFKRGMENYQAIISGKKQFKSLNQEEKNEVVEIMNLIKRSGSSYSDSDSEDCRDAKDNASSYADDLASYAARLKRCAENKSFSDDCYSEFRRTKSSHSDYESAVSEVQSECEDY